MADIKHKPLVQLSLVKVMWALITIVRVSEGCKKKYSSDVICNRGYLVQHDQAAEYLL